LNKTAVHPFVRRRRPFGPATGSAKRGAADKRQTALYLCELRSSRTSDRGSQFNVFAALDIDPRLHEVQRRPLESKIERQR